MKRSDLLKLVQAAMDEYDVYGPVQRRTTWVFDKIDDPSRIDMDYDNTMMSLKKFFIPSKEVMMRFNLREMSIDDSLPDVKAERPQLLVGVHACDIHALLFLDRVFGGKYVDPYYVARRENTTIIGLNCIDPCKHGFCKSVNTHIVNEGYDLYLTPITGDKYYVHVGSPKGDRLLTIAGKLLREATDEGHEAFKASMKHKHESLPVGLHLDNINETFDMAWDDPIWARLGEECMNCGSCALVCPTCYCYDVADELDLSLSNADRTRKWSTCLYHDFALVAGPHNFREDPPARLKYRFYHKIRGALHDHGIIACTGCGRCIEHCPAGISVKDVVYELQKRRVGVPVVKGG